MFFLCRFIICALLTGSSMAATEKNVYGYVEKIILTDKKMTLSAKLDTGAKSASLSAIQIREFQKGGKIYMRYIVPNKEQQIEFISEYVGRSKIKIRPGEQHIEECHMTSIKRPVVLIRIQLGDKEHVIRVNLTNRQRFNYPLLLGRDAIKAFDGVVNPAAVFTIKYKKVE